MSRICDVTGKTLQVGHNVSHSNIKTKRRFMPNLQTRRFWVEAQKRFVTLKVSQQGLRIIDKLGIEKVLEKIQKRKKKD